MRHLPQYIPGNPNFVVENMPGAGSLIATNHLYNRAAQDGTVLGSVSRNIPHYAFAKKPNANFDPLKFNWIGSPEMTNRGCFARADLGIDRAEDLYERELLVGTDGAGTSLSEMPVLLKNLLGMKFRTVDGYKGSNDIVLAMQRNEVRRHLPDRHGVLAIGAADARRRHVPHPVHHRARPRAAPQGADHLRVRQDRRRARRSSTSRPRRWRPGGRGSRRPNVPADRVAALRRAFDATMKDQAFLDDAKKRSFEVNPRTGEQIEAVLRKAAAFPPDLLAKLATLTKR